jgi:hypothetical protein
MLNELGMLNERLVTIDGQTDGRDYEITSCLINY